MKRDWAWATKNCDSSHSITAWCSSRLVLRVTLFQVRVVGLGAMFEIDVFFSIGFSEHFFRHSLRIGQKVVSSKQKTQERSCFPAFSLQRWLLQLGCFLPSVFIIVLHLHSCYAAFIFSPRCLCAWFLGVVPYFHDCICKQGAYERCIHGLRNDFFQGGEKWLNLFFSTQN